MTIHNIEYQGKYDQAILGDVFGLSEADRSTVEYNGCINLLKGAIVCADMVSTVSERYADELLTEYYSCGLHYILRERRDCLCGIVNGIDTSYYDPETDPDIVRNYSAKDCSFKSENKTELQRICGIDTDPSKPLMIMVTRLASHKGVELVSRVFSDLMRDTDLTFAVLGTGEAQYEDFFRRAAVDYPGRVGVHLTYDKALSKKYYAGGDMFLMPSKSEPCGLSQMIAARYGTVPIVRETGGLVDTIRPYNEFTGDGNGFSFTNYNAHEMMETIKYALKQYGIKKQWNALMRRAMNTDFSWGASAEKYLALYRRML